MGGEPCRWRVNQSLQRTQKGSGRRGGVKCCGARERGASERECCGRRKHSEAEGVS
jgi:hypothetical protein